MKDNNTVEQLGTVITSWKYKPQKSKKALYFLIGLLGGGVIFLLYYGKELLPWLKEIPEYVLYFAIFLISPFIKFFSGKKQDQEWTLFDKGYTLRLMEDEKVVGETMGYWRDFSTCIQKEKHVLLTPINRINRTVRLNTPHNTMDIYMVCRELISMAWEETTVKQIHDAHIVKSRHQKHLEKYEKKVQKRNKKLYGNVI